jgi:CHAD domain-containing protein
VQFVPLEDDVPAPLAGLVRARTRGAPLVPQVRLRSRRDVRHLVDGDGALLAEASTDTVRAERLTGGDTGTAEWTEIEVELADGGDPAFLDTVGKRLRKKGLKPSGAPSKLAKALRDTGWRPAQPPEEDGTAGGRVLAHLRKHTSELVAYDAAVRRDLPDSVHRMRVATRRLRSAFRTYKKVLDPAVTGPVADELKWLAHELGVDRDQEVLAERLTARIDALPVTLLLGPVRGRLRAWDGAGRTGSRGRTLAALDSDRYTALLDSLDALLADPPLRPAARKDADAVLARAIRKEHARLAARVDRALALPAGHDRDVALHEARKAAKRARYAGETAAPVLGGPARRFVKRVKAVQKVLGDHQDSVVARATLRDLAVQAHLSGETAFTWGLLYGEEEAGAAERERELPGVWARASVPAKLRK